MDQIVEHFKDDTEVTKYIATLLQPYVKMHRDCSDGPRNLGESLQLTDDFFCFNFLHKFRRRYIFVKENGDDGEDTDDTDEMVEIRRQRTVEQM